MPTKRVYKGEADATLLIGYMKNGPAARRSTLVEIVSALQRLEGIQPITRSGEQTIKAQEERVRLNRLLRMYKAVPVIESPRQKGARISLKWSRRDDSVTRRRQISGESDVELIVVLTAVRLAEEGLIHKIRRCERSHAAWFFARKNASRWCTAKCKGQYYSQKNYDKLFGKQRNPDGKIKKSRTRKTELKKSKPRN